MSADGYEEVIQIPGGEVLVRISRHESSDHYREIFWKGTIACRECISDPFKEMIYVFEKDLHLVKYYINKILKNIFYLRPDK